MRIRRMWGSGWQDLRQKDATPEIPTILRSPHHHPLPACCRPLRQSGSGAGGAHPGGKNTPRRDYNAADQAVVHLPRSRYAGDVEDPPGAGCYPGGEGVLTAPYSSTHARISPLFCRSWRSRSLPAPINRVLIRIRPPAETSSVRR